MSSRAAGHFLLYRDFQSRNIMVRENGIGLVDWQGARRGPLGYDLASLLLDPYVELSGIEIEHLYGFYRELLVDHDTEMADPFDRYYPYLAIQRNLQILGAFAFLSRERKKTYFEAYIPASLKSLRRLLRELNDPGLSPLRDLLNSLACNSHRHTQTFTDLKTY
jgi:aminoglycoside/choline kinase family phosphotransferase